MDFLSKKKLLRTRLLKKRKDLSRALRRQKSRKIFARLFKVPKFRKAEKIAVYFSVTPEVETRPLLARLLKNRRIFLPRVDPCKKGLVLHRVKALGRDLRKGAYSIMEPRPRCPRADASMMDLMIVPGVGFDKKGNRLGRGAGYYDRLLKKAKKVHKIGICFREQIVGKIPMTGHDVPVDQVITD